jgi:2,3-bisphosphoglycerate-independent phosphoglycerate mutase
VIEAAGERELHVAETEKYAHVTYFFNGGREQPYDGERWGLVPSQRDVPTHDHKPQMSARQITDAFLGAFAEDSPRFSIINFANADMVGHTGVIPAAVSEVETIDACLQRLVQPVQAAGGVCVITADHGNAEHMLEADDRPNTAHSLSLVPSIVTARGLKLEAGGTLADVAPTVLALLGIESPTEITGRSLLEPARERPQLTPA